MSFELADWTAGGGAMGLMGLIGRMGEAVLGVGIIFRILSVDVTLQLGVPTLY